VPGVSVARVSELLEPSLYLHWRLGREDGVVYRKEEVEWGRVFGHYEMEFSGFGSSV